MKVCIHWDSWHEFPFLQPETDPPDEASVDIPEELHKRWHDTVGEMERIIEELDTLQEKQSYDPIVGKENH